MANFIDTLNMKANIITLLASILFLITLLPVNAQVVLSHSNNGDDVTRSVDITRDTGGVGIENSGDFATSGSFTGGVDGDSFNLFFETASNWSFDAGTTPTDFINYINSGIVAAVEIDNTSNAMGVNSGTLIEAGGDPQEPRFNLPGEAIIMTVDTTGLNANTQLVFNSFATELLSGDVADHVVYDISENVFLNNVWDVTAGGLNQSAHNLSDGDIVVWANGNTAGAGWRLENLEFDLVTIPEPSTVGLLGLGLLAILFKRTRRLHA